MPRRDRVHVFEVSTRQHGTCYLTSLTAALTHVKRCVQEEGATTVKLSQVSTSRRAWDALPATCEFGK